MTRATLDHSAETRIVTPDDDDYPRLLRHISDPPQRLYIRGRALSSDAIAVVGSRECTPYGRRVAYRMGADLAAAGFTVVSGLARGIDSASHRGALDGGGVTVAVLPCGIDRVYPPRNRALARRIARNGALVTEFEPGTLAARWRFPQRNRLIAGLAWITVVVEAAARSGAKITARLALEYSREVLAVPGPVDAPMSAGANALLSQGAHVCADADSVLGHLEPALRDAGRARLAVARGELDTVIDGLDEVARSILSLIPRHGSCGIERLAATCALDVRRVLAVLTEIEARGLIRSLGRQRYERT